MKALVRVAIRSLPYRLKRFIAREIVPSLNFDDGYNLISASAPDHNISRFGVSGDLGEFESLCQDDTILRIYANRGTWAVPTIGCLSLLFKKNLGSYIDIGANIGITTVPIARLGVKCYAFEPEPNNYISLLRNINKNLVAANVSAYDVALSDQIGHAEFNRSAKNLGDHRLGQPLADSLEVSELDSISVRTSPLDAFDLELPDPLGVKIDAQGAEPLILKGGISILSKASLLILEFSPFHMKRFIDNPTEILLFLEKSFEKIALIQGDGMDFVFFENKVEAIKLLSSFFDYWVNKNETNDSYYDIFAFKGVGNQCFEDLKVKAAERSRHQAN